MRFIDSKKVGEFGNSKSISEDFLLLNYETDKDEYKNNLVGTDSTRRKLIILKRKKDNYLEYERISKEFNFDIHHVIVGLTNKDNENIYLILEKNGERFNIYKYDLNNAEPEKVTETEIMPFFIINEKHNRVFVIRNKQAARLLIFDDYSHKLTKFELSKKYYPEIKESDILELQKNHSSAFLDLDGDGHPDLILDIKKKDQRILKMFFTKNLLKHELILPSNSGPIIFEDFDKSGYMDLCYVENSDQESLIKIIHNGIKNYNIPFSKKSKETILRLSNFIDSDYKPIFEINQIDMIGGIFSFDLNLTQYPSICVIVEKENVRELKIFSAKLKKENTFSFFKKKENFELEFKLEKSVPISNLISVSCLDPQRIGREGLILNILEEGKYQLHYFENNLEFSNNKLSFLTLDNNKNKQRNRPLPGVSYSINADGQELRNNVIISASWLSLRKPLVTFGLGSINLLIDDVKIGIPYQKEINLNRKVIPNSDLLLNYRNGDLEVELLLKYSYYIQMVFITLGVVLLINLMLVVLFTIIEKKRALMQKQKESNAFNFRAI